MTLKTRKPTGAVPWPLVLIEGGEKVGKGWACAELTASPKVGRCLWLDLSEGAGDEYGAIPGADYEVIDHDGTWASILGQVADAKAEAARAAAAGEKPVVLAIDSMTAEWDLLKAMANEQAARSDYNKERIRKDPGAEIKVPMNLWNDATARHRKLMTILMTFPGIVVMTARGKEVASLDANGRPVEGTKEYKVEGHKTLAFDASVWVRLSRERPPVVVGARSVHTGIRPGVDEPQEAKNFTLEWLIFDALRCDPAKAHARNLTETRTHASPEEIRDEALETTTGADRIGELWRDARMAWPDKVLPNEHGDDENLVALLERVGAERREAEVGSQRRAPARTAQGARPSGESIAEVARVSAEYPDGVSRREPAHVPGRAADGDAEARFVATFTVALSNSRTPDSLDARGADIRAAKREGVISAEIANELLDQLAEAKRTAQAAA